jgi:hypothetical protein
MAELDEHGRPIPGTAAPLPSLMGEQRMLVDGAGQAYRRSTAGVGSGFFTFFMVERGEMWESIPPETPCIHPETGDMVSVQDLPWSESVPV